jgi:mRNA-degrading endonuclease RelE of RelBE toxin-antitoxin system
MKRRMRQSPRLPLAGTTDWNMQSYALADYPERCPVAPEARRMKRKIRHLLYGTKSHIYRVIYDIDERRKAVWILTIRHGARKQLRPSDLE